MFLSDKDPFGLGKWQDFLNQLSWLKENNIQVESVKILLEEYRKKMEEEKLEGYKVLENTPRCPACNSIFQLLPVNDSPATQTGDDSKSVWLCRQCGEATYSTKTIEEELKSCQVD